MMTTFCTSFWKAKPISADELKASLRKSTIALKVFPGGGGNGVQE